MVWRYVTLGLFLLKNASKIEQTLLLRQSRDCCAQDRSLSFVRFRSGVVVKVAQIEAQSTLKSDHQTPGIPSVREFHAGEFRTRFDESFLCFDVMRYSFRLSRAHVIEVFAGDLCRGIVACC